MYLKLGNGINIEPNIVWYFVCGCVWGISIVVPGLSSSSTLIFLGLYQPMVDGVSDLRLDVLLPILIGIVLTIILLSRGVSKLYERHHSVASHIIIGIVIATTIPIIPYSFESVAQGLLALVCLLAGVAIAFVVSVVCPKLAQKAQIE
jgi:putative membrane protein